MIRVQDITLALDESEALLTEKAAKKLRIKIEDIQELRIFKKAIDARKKAAIKWVYTVDVATTKDKMLIDKKRATQTPDMQYQYPTPGTVPMKHRPVVVGSGPCGLFTALILSQMGYRPLVIERGADVDTRVQDVEAFWDTGVFKAHSNVQFGEGGAGTFSDGKLTTQIKNKRCHKVLAELVKAGAPEEVAYKNKPHVGTDILRTVVKAIREEIVRLGGSYRFNTCLTDLRIEDGRLAAIELNGNEWLDTEVCVLALGHSARDTFEMLYDKQLTISQKPFAMGMRIEHLQSWIDEGQYGDAEHAKVLGAAEYKLVHHCENGRAVYSFCMCPGGYVVASASEVGGVVTNGMSEHKRDGENANSAILVNVTPDDFGSSHPLAGMQLQRRFEALAYTMGGNTYEAPCQTVGDFLNNVPTTALGCVQPTYKPGVVLTNISEALPPFMREAVGEALVSFGKKINRFDHPEALLTGFETRSSSPIRIQRNSLYESNIQGIYPAGEGAGYAGGITSAGVDGIEVAEAIVSHYAQPNICE